MTAFLSSIGWPLLYVFGGLVGAALVMALVLSPWLVRNWWVSRPAVAVVRAAERMTREAVEHESRH